VNLFRKEKTMNLRPHGLIALGLLLAASPAIAQSKSKQSGKKPPTASANPKPLTVTANDPVSKIAEAYRKDQNAFFQAAPKDEKAQQKYFEKYGDIPKRYLPLFKQAAAKHKGTEQGIEALLQIMEIAPAAGDQAALKSSLKELNSEAYLGSTKMEQAAQQVMYLYLPDAKNLRDEFLKKLIEKSPHKNVQAAAMFVLASSVIENRGMAGDSVSRDDAMKMLRELTEKYAETRYGKRAGGYIFEAENLQIGMTAPDIEGEDENGAKFKLSDYRGKVVVLDFWGFW
jgi:hypothetical protein